MDYKTPQTVYLTGRQEKAIKAFAKQLMVNEGDAHRRVLDAWIDGNPIPCPLFEAPKQGSR